MPRSLLYFHAQQTLDLKPAEVDALDPQILDDLFTIRHLSREITPADG